MPVKEVEIKGRRGRSRETAAKRISEDASVRGGRAEDRFEVGVLFDKKKGLVAFVGECRLTSVFSRRKALRWRVLCGLLRARVGSKLKGVAAHASGG